MKKFFCAIAFCSAVLAAFAVFIARTAEAEQTRQVQNSDILDQLLRLPAPPPPNPLMPKSPQRLRAQEFYSIDNPPDDNAPIEDILDYWFAQNSRYGDLRYNPVPSDTVVDRILTEVERDPSRVTDFLNIFRDSKKGADLVRKIYREKLAEIEGEDDDGYYNDSLYRYKSWLKNNTDEFSDELLKEVENVGATDDYVSSNFEQLLTLSKVDWDKAAPIVNRLYNDISKPTGKVLATWALYKHALETDSFGDVERYREELKEIVEDKNAGDGARDLALDAISKERDFSGRDQWYLGLLEDETLGDLRVGGRTYTGLTTLMLHERPEKFRAAMLELVRSSNPTLRNAAVRNLTAQMNYPVNERNEEVIRALIPWLQDPNWAKDINGSRAQLVRALASVKIPESVPGLITLLDEQAVRREEDRLGSTVNTSANVSSPIIGTANAAAEAGKAVANAVGKLPSGPSYPFRQIAISALGTQGSIQAVPALKRILPELSTYIKTTAIRAIWSCGGYTVFEQVNAIEAFALAKIGEERAAANAGANTSYFSIYGLDNEKYTNLEPIMLGAFLMNRSVMMASPDIVRQTLERSESWQRRDPAVAAEIRNFINGWHGPAVNTVLLNDLKNGRASTDIIVRLLSQREELRDEHAADISAARSGGAIAAGVASCLMEQRTDQEAILVGDDVQAKTALLACGRLVRAKLPVAKVAELLSSGNKRIVKAAELYLESEDSAEARAVLFARFPDQARIFGATRAFIPDEAIPSEYLSLLFSSVSGSPFTFYPIYGEDVLVQREEWLRQEVLRDEKILGAYYYDGNTVWIYSDKVIYTWGEDPARYMERTMKQAEYDNLRNFFAAYDVAELKPFISCERACPAKELIMVGRAGGRRVFNARDEGSEPEFFRELNRFFESLKREPGKLKYAAGRRVPGLKVEFANENYSATAVWASGDDVRVMVEDKAARNYSNKQLREEWAQIIEQAKGKEVPVSYPELFERRRWDGVSWMSFTDEGIAGTVSEPDEFDLMKNKTIDSLPPSENPWQTKTADLEVRIDPQNPGVYKIANGRVQKILDEYAAYPLLTPNGRWMFVSIYEDGSGLGLYRVDMANGRQMKISYGEMSALETIAYVPALKKVLVGESYGEHDMMHRFWSDDGNYFWVDPETGVVTKASGTLRPLFEQTFRPLQKAEGEHQFWAAILDEKKNTTNIGIYDASKLVFTPKLALPEMRFTSMEMWANPVQNKIYLVYDGHLLSVPLPK